MYLGDNFTTDISKQLDIANVKVQHYSSTKVKYMGQMLKHSDRYISLNYMERILSCLALQGWNENNLAKVLNCLSTSNLH